MDYCCFGTNPYCCPCAPPGFLCQPHHLPGYLGHCPTMRDRVGGTFGRLSRDILEDPCAVAAPGPVLVPEACNKGCCCCGPRFSHGEERFYMKGQLAPRCPCTDVYRCNEPMNESYKGHVPGFFNCTYGPTHGRTVYSTKIFLHDAEFYGNMKYFNFRDPLPPGLKCANPPLQKPTGGKRT